MVSNQQGGGTTIHSVIVSFQRRCHEMLPQCALFCIDYKKGHAESAIRHLWVLTILTPEFSCLFPPGPLFICVLTRGYIDPVLPPATGVKILDRLF